jgi:hypothetical protein
MATTNSIIVLDVDDEDEVPAHPGPSHSPPSLALCQGEAPGSSEPHGPGGSSISGRNICYKLENEKLFEEAHSAKKKLNLAPAATTSSEPSGNNPSTDPSLGSMNAEATVSEAPRTRGSGRQIQRLEQLLALYVAEIRRLIKGRS